MKDILGLGKAFSALIGLGKWSIILVVIVILSIAGLIRTGYQNFKNSDVFYPKYEIYICNSYNEQYALPGVTEADEDRVGLKVFYNAYQSKVFYWENMTDKMKEEFLDLGGVEETFNEAKAHMYDLPDLN